MDFLKVALFVSEHFIAKLLKEDETVSIFLSFLVKDVSPNVLKSVASVIGYEKLSSTHYFWFIAVQKEHSLSEVEKALRELPLKVHANAFMGNIATKFMPQIFELFVCSLVSPEDVFEIYKTAPQNKDVIKLNYARLGQNGTIEWLYKSEDMLDRRADLMGQPIRASANAYEYWQLTVGVKTTKVI